MFADIVSAVSASKMRSCVRWSVTEMWDPRRQSTRREGRTASLRIAASAGSCVCPFGQYSAILGTLGDGD